MKLVPLTSTYFNSVFVVRCLCCGKRVMSDSGAYADLDGKAYLSYLCKGCGTEALSKGSYTVREGSDGR